MNVKRVLKILLLLGLLALYSFYGGFASPKDISLFRLCITNDAMFTFGAVVALRGGNSPIGILHPVSLRGIFIALGSVAMIRAFVVMVATREDRAGKPRWPFDKPSATRPGRSSLLILNCYA